MRARNFSRAWLSVSLVLGLATPSAAEEPLGILHVKGNVYLIHGAGPNITVQVGEEIVTLVNTGPPNLSDQIRSLIHTISDKPIGFIINTSADAEYTAGNENLAKGGFFMLSSANQQRSQSSVVAHLGVLEVMNTENRPKGDWPTDTYDEPEWHLYANDEPIILFHPAKAHSNGDTVAFFRRSDVVSTGGIFDMTGYPVIDQKHSGSIAGILAELNHLLKDVTIPQANEEGGTLIIPGHGHITDRNDLANYRDMLTIIRDRIDDGVKKHLTLEQVKATKPTYDYDGGYGSATGPWTSDMFIEAIYRELNAGQNNARQIKGEAVKK